MTQGATEATTETAGQTSADTSTEATTTTTEATTATDAATTDGEAALGDAGKKALDAMKAKWKEAEKRATERDAAAAALQAKLDGKEAEHTAAQERAATEKAALDKANDRILKSEVKAAAKGVLADPQDAYKFLDLESFEVDNDGNVDESAIADALTRLITEKPYLAAQGGQRFKGTADSGARTDTAKPSQLTKADMAGMSPEQIVEAHDAGRFDDLTRGS